MAKFKIHDARCPTCGANLPVAPGQFQVMCRYCQNVIEVEHAKAPAHIVPFGMPGAMPSRKLYIDPAAAQAAAKAGRTVGFVILGATLLPVLIPLGIFVIPWGIKTCNSVVKPFPVECSSNELVEVSGSWEGTTPIVTSVAGNCRIHIKNSKLKGSSLFKTDAYNVELWLDNVTIETTDTAVKSGSNLKMKLHGTTITSAGNAFETDANTELQEFVNSTIESKGGTAIKTKSSLKIHAENSKIRGKKNALDTDSSLDVSLKKNSEITSSDGIAIKTTSSFKLDAEGGKIDGAGGGIVSSSSTTIEATGLTLSSSKEPALTTSSSFKLNLTDGAITSTAEAAVLADGCDMTLVNTKITGAEAGLSIKNSFKVKATKGTRIVATTGYGIITTSNPELTMSDAAIEAAIKAFKSGSNAKLKLGQGARLAGKRGGIDVDSNADIEATGATIDGGNGPGLLATSYNAKVALHGGAIKGVPAVQFDHKPTSFTIDGGTRVDGEQKVAPR